MKRIVVLSLLLLFVAGTTGCSWTGMSADQQYVTALQSLTTAAQAVDVYVQAGKFSPDELKQIAEITKLSRKVMATWKANLELGLGTTDSIRAFNEILREWAIMRIEAEGIDKPLAAMQPPAPVKPKAIK